MFWLSYFALWALVIFQTAVLVELVRRVSGRQAHGSEPYISADALEKGTPAPEFVSPRLGRIEGMLDSRAHHGRRVLLGFLSADCFDCRLAAKRAPEAATRLGAELVCICRGTLESCTEFAEKFLPGIDVGHDSQGGIGSSYHIGKTPMFVLVDESWRVSRYGYPVLGNDPTLGYGVPATLTTSTAIERGPDDNRL